ncbi:hypothetical protein K458DRAFT_462602 [Lentithecium fluviatile CBS 122367]|uniref:Uncharacterized protein n=1 Tax=Lentithecium fluviatile CBS 122367 TaxID=1168545 RepID=A0A6G1JH92_9PLEO|nr:hypothetical protein K458DRAFT_462602 [Lentithecium fluviatile CBS 122367]
MKPPKDSEYFFRGNDNVLSPHHMTRYIYPSYLSYPKSYLLLQPLANGHKRSHPVGRAFFSPNGSEFVTITPSGRQPPTKAQFDAWLNAEKAIDKKSRDPLGRAMRRVSGYQGNTVLESGRFRLKKGPPCTAEVEGHGSWWVWLHDLYQGKFDRAFWCARETMDALDIPAPLTKWYPRPDVEKAVVRIEKNARRYRLQPGEKYSDGKYWRCLLCRLISEVSVDRANIIRVDELPWWRWRIAMRRLEQLQIDWLMVVSIAAVDRWVDELPGEVISRGNAQEMRDLDQGRIPLRDAIELIDNIPIYVAKLLPWGFSLDNPVNTKEGDVLKQHLIGELRRLANSGRR